MAFLEIANSSFSVKWVYVQQKTTPVKYIVSTIFIQNTDQTNCLVRLLKIQQVLTSEEALNLEMGKWLLPKRQRYQLQ